MAVEKIYSFSAFDDDKEIVVNVKESELNPDQKSLILGELIHQYGEAPDSVKAEFLVWALKQPDEIKC